MKRTILGLMLTLLLVGIIGFALNIARAQIEYDKGVQYFNEAPSQATYGEQMAKYKDAWKQGVKVLELGFDPPITSGIVRPP